MGSEWMSGLGVNSSDIVYAEARSYPVWFFSLLLCLASGMAHR